MGEFNATGNVQRLVTWGANGLVSRDGSITVERYMFDPMGNVVNRPSGTTLSTDAGYDAFGTGYGNPSAPYGYGGQWGYYTDTAAGLILCTHRYYDPATGRWLTRDPIGYKGGINLYGYVGDDPIDFTDPLGEIKWPKVKWPFPIKLPTKEQVKEVAKTACDAVASGIESVAVAAARSFAGSYPCADCIRKMYKAQAKCEKEGKCGASANDRSNGDALGIHCIESKLGKAYVANCLSHCLGMKGLE